MWNNGVRSLILYLGYRGHIVNPPISGITPRPDHVPSYPPTLSLKPTMAELETSRTWWEKDNVVSHILTSRLTATVLSIPPLTKMMNHLRHELPAQFITYYDNFLACTITRQVLRSTQSSVVFNVVDESWIMLLNGEPVSLSFRQQDLLSPFVWL